MGRQIARHPGRPSTSANLCPATACSVSPKPGSRHSRSRRSAPAAVARDGARDLFGERQRQRRDLHRRRQAARRRGLPESSAAVIGDGASCESKRAIFIERHHALAPAALCLHILAHGQSIEELVGDQEQRPVRRRGSSKLSRPGKFHAAILQLFFLRLLQRRTGFDQHALPARRRNSGAQLQRRAARPPSACRGQDRARPAAAGCGFPWSCQTCATQSPKSSPNIWLISGAVMKSPAAPKGSRVA